jgi:hypothetical protein
MVGGVTPKLFSTQGWNIPGLAGGSTFGSPVLAGEPLDLYDAFNIDGVSQSRGLAGVNSLTSGAVAASGGAEVAIPAGSWLFQPMHVFRPGRIYRVDVQCDLIGTAIASYTALRVRRGLATVLGTQLAQRDWPYNPPVAGAPTAATLSGYIKNATGAPISDFLSLTNMNFFGIGVVSLSGNAAKPLTMTVTDVTNLAADLAPIAVQI